MTHRRPVTACNLLAYRGHGGRSRPWGNARHDGGRGRRAGGRCGERGCLIRTASLPAEQAQLVELARQLPAGEGRQDAVLGLLPAVPATPTASVSPTTRITLGLPCTVSVAGAVVPLQSDRPLPVGLWHACRGRAGHAQWGGGLGGGTPLGEQSPLLLQYVQQLVLLGHGAAGCSHSSRRLEGSVGGCARRLGCQGRGGPSQPAWP